MSVLKARYAREYRQAIEHHRDGQASAIRAAVNQLQADGVTPTRPRVEEITDMHVRNRMLQIWREAVGLARSAG